MATRNKYGIVQLPYKGGATATVCKRLYKQMRTVTSQKSCALLSEHAKQHGYTLGGLLGLCDYEAAALARSGIRINTRRKRFQPKGPPL